MTRKYRLYQIDSFTKNKFSGNPAGVITNADGLTETEMKQIARELNNSETAFIFSSDNPQYAVHVRFFTPTIEVPICGHATIAAHYARAVEMQLDTTTVHHKTGAGILPVDVIRDQDDYKIIMKQGAIEFGPVIEGEDKAYLIDALNISEEDLMENCPIQIVSTGHSKVMIGLRKESTLHLLSPKYEALAELSKRIDCNGFYTFTLDSKEDDILVKGRMFAPAIGIQEDPVTGNANGPLGAYLIQHHLVQHDGSVFEFKAKQGEAIGRSGVMGVAVEIENGAPVGVSISGTAVIVFQSELCI